MCGIAGFLEKVKKFGKDDLEKMSVALSHRGPDASGIFEENQAGLAHTRLSILDLSERGNQPMVSHNKRYVMVYNGEVYNYREIASELVSVRRGQSTMFSSSSDSEVILEAFSQWGPAFVQKLNGMFAIAIYDRELEEIHIFRDRIGIKPLYYSWNEGSFIFASELKAIVATGKIKKEVDHHAVAEFLNLGFIPSPYCIYKDIKKLDPGTYLKVNKNGMQRQKYWSLKTSVSEEYIRNEKKALVKLSDLLISSVQYQLKSDVPFGVFLSGGIDSSLITAQAAYLSNVKINTFSIGFEENRFDESVHAKAVANYLKTNHHEFIVSYKDALDLIDSLFDAYGEPFADSSAIPTMLVSKLAKQHVTVTLSGEGGDELFLGYGAYKWANRLSNPLISGFRKQIHGVLSNLNDNRYRRAAQLFNYENKSEVVRHIFSQEQYLFSSREVQNLMTEKPVLEDFKFELDIKRDLVPEEIQAMFDLQYYLPDDLLIKVDRASMKYSLETRVPYLDHRIVELALNLSPELKIRGGVSKYILKEILYQFIPEKFFQRPKQGFAIPLNKWLEKELSFLIDDYLNKQMIERYGFVKYSEVEALVKKFRSGHNYLYNRVWLLIILHKFLDRNMSA